MGKALYSNLRLDAYGPGFESSCVQIFFCNFSYIFTARCTFSAKRGIAIACRLSVRLSLRLSVTVIGKMRNCGMQNAESKVRNPKMRKGLQNGG